MEHALAAPVGGRDGQSGQGAAVDGVGRGVAQGVPGHRLGRVDQQVAVLVGQGHDAVAARGDVVEGEVALFVGTGHKRGGCIGVAVGRHGQHLAPRLPAAGVAHLSGQHQGVHVGSGGEDIFVAGQQVAFGEVGDGFLELEEVGGIGPQAVVQLHQHPLAFHAVVGFLRHGGRHQHVLGGVFEHHKFVELDEELRGLEVACLVEGLAAHHLGRLAVARPSAGVSLPGTGP